MRHLLGSMVAATLAAFPVCSQSFLIVDANNATGTIFPEIQSAVDAANPGDIILVRTGTYFFFEIDKSITLVADGAVTLSSITGNTLFRIRDTMDGDEVVIRGFAAFLFGGDGFEMVNNRGRILLDQFDSIGLSGDNLITDCDQVVLNQSTLAGANIVTRSTISASGCEFLGEPNPNTPSSGLTLTDSTAYIADSTMLGGGTTPFFPVQPGAGLEMSNSTATVAGDATHSIAAGNGFAQTQSAIIGDGTLVLDPDVPLIPVGAVPAITGTFAQTNPELSRLTAVGGALGGTSQVDLYAEPGDAFFLLVGQPGNAVPIAFLGGEIWLDLTATAVLNAGTVGATGQETFQFPVPNLMAALGVQVSWVAITGGSSLQLTNNARYTHGL